MHDIELLLCTRPVSPELVPLLDQIVEWDAPRTKRAALVSPFRSLIVAELAGSGDRWTPHYDQALRTLARDSDEDLLDPSWDDVADPVRSDRFEQVRKQLAIHTRLCERIALAESGGARTLAAAFECLAIPGNELHTWFLLCPDRKALDRRLRDAALSYLRGTRAESRSPEVEDELLEAVLTGRAAPDLHRLRMVWYSHGQPPERCCAVGILMTDVAAIERSFADVPAALMAYLGNPFDPPI
jgi:hypothetical protein